MSGESVFLDAGPGKELAKVGVSFDPVKRNVGQWVVG